MRVARAVPALPLGVFGQIGFPMLVGLAAKVSILIVAFGREKLQEGEDSLDVAKEAAKSRMRPIIMRSLAFIVVTLPPAIAAGAGANARMSIGTTIVGGMLVASALSLLVTPVFFAVANRGRRRAWAAPPPCPPS